MIVITLISADIISRVIMYIPRCIWKKHSNIFTDINDLKNAFPPRGDDD